MNKNPLLLFGRLLAVVPMSMSCLSQAQLTDDFDPPNSNVTSTQAGSVPGPTVVTGGPTGDFLRITEAVNSQSNRYIYDNTDAGAYDTVNAQWDYRASTGSTADGFGFALLPTSVYGATGDAADATVAEEPNIDGAFAVGIDLYPSDAVNDISFHYDGIEFTNLTNLDGGIVDLNSGSFHRFDLSLQRVGNGTNATLAVTSDFHGVPGTTRTVLDEALPFLPYENRVGLFGRTGGANVAQDVDNLNVTSSAPFAGGLPVAPQGNLFQDFDSEGATSYVTRSYAITDGGTTRPGARLFPDDGQSDGAFMRLINDGVNTNRNAITFNRAPDGGITNEIQTLSMDLRLSSAGNPADGVAVLFLPTAQYGRRGAGPDGGEFEQGAATANALKVGFDLYDGQNDLFVHFGNTQIAQLDIDPGVVDFNSGVFNRFHISLEPTDTSVELTVSVETDINAVNGPAGAPTQIAAVSLPGGVVFDYRVQIGGRTGGAFHNADIDNIRITPTPVPQTDYTSQSFDGNLGTDTGFKAYPYGAGRAPEFVSLTRDAATTRVLRLMHDGVNDTQNAVAFDQTVDGELNGDQLVVVDFDFRMESVDAGADGFSMRLLPTATYGAFGPGAAFTGTGGAASAELPNFPDVLAVGFRIYNGAPFNGVTLHWNGSEIANVVIPDGDLNLDDGTWHHARLIWAPAAGSGSDVTLILNETVTVANSLNVPDLDLYAYRLEFAGRSGSLNMSVDLDNIYAAASDVLNADSDNDGLLNVWEIENDLDPFDDTGDNGRDGDPDEDGLKNIDEQAAGTDPNEEDSDNDGLLDGWETDDGNFVSATETGTDPLDPDSDDDGLSDGVENPLLAYDPQNAANQPGTDPNDPNSDGDAFTDGQEIFAGSDPTDPLDFPTLGENVVLKEDFDIFHLNSVYTLHNASGAPAEVIDSMTSHGKVLRLTSKSGDINNNAAWDFVATPGSQLEIRVQFSMSADDGSQAADGFGIGFFSTASQGTTGESLLAGSWDNPYTENYPGGVFVAFDTYDNVLPTPDGNNIRVTGLGGNTEQIADVQPPFTINTGVFHEAVIVVTSDGAGGGRLSVSVVEDIDGAASEYVVVANAALPGLDPTTFEGRLIMGGRTGGAVVETLIDCVQISSLTPAEDFRILSIVPDAGMTQVTLTWNSLPAVAEYYVYKSSDLISWVEVSDVPAAPGTTSTVLPVDLLLEPDLFFKVSDQPLTP